MSPTPHAIARLLESKAVAIPLTKPAFSCGHSTPLPPQDFFKERAFETVPEIDFFSLAPPPPPPVTRADPTPR